MGQSGYACPAPEQAVLCVAMPPPFPTVITGRRQSRLLSASQIKLCEGYCRPAAAYFGLCFPADEAVMLEKDPKNEFDPHAIRVRRLNGGDLGFVPKDLTIRFPHDVTFGHIHYVDQVPESGVWGALVTTLLLLPKQ